MSNSKFIEQIAAYVQKYAASYGICVHSPIIAQAILESASGTSELATNANNFFGLKWRANRCPSASGHYIKVGSEQNADGSYVSSAMKWFAFPDIEAGVKGYFDFINIANYANLKGVTDPKTYLENIKADGYATSLKYVENLLNVIERYGLTKYDNEKAQTMLKIAIDAGHGLNTAGKRCLKSLDEYQTREWVLNSRIADKLGMLLNLYNCEILRVDDQTGRNDVSLNNRCNKSDEWGADVYISIHHNAGINGGKGGGIVVFYYSSKAERKAQAEALYKAIAVRTGLTGNRSGKVINKGFAVLKNTDAPAFLIENGFMDSATDVPIILSEEHADKTAQALLDFLIKSFNLSKKQDAGAEAPEKAPEAPQTASNLPYLVKVTASALNVRAGAGMQFKIKTSVKKGEVFTIIEESAGWGKLKSGAGWIRLSYTQKL